MSDQNSTKKRALVRRGLTAGAIRETLAYVSDDTQIVLRVFDEPIEVRPGEFPPLTKDMLDTDISMSVYPITKDRSQWKTLYQMTEEEKKSPQVILAINQIPYTEEEKKKHEAPQWLEWDETTIEKDPSAPFLKYARVPV